MPRSRKIVALITNQRERDCCTPTSALTLMHLTTQFFFFFFFFLNAFVFNYLHIKATYQCIYRDYCLSLLKNKKKNKSVQNQYSIGLVLLSMLKVTLSVSLDTTFASIHFLVGLVHYSPASTFFSKNNFKIEPHSTIHSFKNYFTTIFSVFSKKQYPNIPLIHRLVILIKKNCTKKSKNLQCKKTLLTNQD